MDDFTYIPFIPSVEPLPGFEAKAVFTDAVTEKVFREDGEISPVVVDDKTKYIPWGADNMMPYNIMELIESDETLTTCQSFNAEVCYAAGLNYRHEEDTHTDICEEVEDFFADNDIPSYFLGACQDFKHFGFAVSVIILNRELTKIVRIVRKEACYCRFEPADDCGRIPAVLYANWRRFPSADRIERIPLLSPQAPLADLKDRIKNGDRSGIYAVVSRIPTPDSTVYPIPPYASLFKGRWYNIKRLIAQAKESKLKNSAPIKYHIEISRKYWENIFREEGITDLQKKRERVMKGKQDIIDFLTGVENSGKVWFSMYFQSPDGRVEHDVIINRIDSTKEGGDWESDIQEAINIICFTMRVHSNLVGSVPGKSQSNNSGSDKRELYTIAQSLQKPYHDILFGVHRLIIRFNGWKGFYPVCPLIQLTTLDQHKDLTLTEPKI